MKRYLPIFIFLPIFFLALLMPPRAYAQATPTTAPITIGVANTPTPGAAVDDGYWVVDSEVTFIGKNAARAGLMLDWALQNYNWVCVTPLASGQCDNTNNPIAGFWARIVFYIVVPLLFFVILATAMVIIITRGRSLTIMRFIPRFIAVILLIIFSYSILQFLYQFTDLIEGFFLRSQPNLVCPPNCISNKDLLYIAWHYETFVGFEKVDPVGNQFAESAFISLLLTKLTALTYFVMVGILLIRKIILWFFVIVSPIFPLLLLYYPVRNTAKIWIGEFFRWLLYAPLFAIFLNGLVYLWRNQIPLNFATGIGEQTAGQTIIFPTAVNILLGGPGQTVSIGNSVNLTDTFALYVVCLIMLWIVILLPWILLQIFLDYASNFSSGDTAVMKTLVNMAGNRPIVPPGTPGGSGTGPGGTGAAVTLPFAKKFNIPVSLKPAPAGSAKEIPTSIGESKFAQPNSIPTAQVKAQVLNIANVTLPSMRDIAKFDIALHSNNVNQQNEVSQYREQLARIANPHAIPTATDRERFSSVQSRLSQESNKGNSLATSILNAANASSRSNVLANNSKVKNIMEKMANPALSSSIIERGKMSSLNSILKKESTDNKNSLASSILSVNQKTSNSEIEKLKEKILDARSQGNPLASSVISEINKSARETDSITKVKESLSQIANPQSAKSAEGQQRMTGLNQAIVAASKEGNSMAASILAVNTLSTTSEIEKLQEKILDEKAKGNPLATTVINEIQRNERESVSTTIVKESLTHVANPATTTSPAERQRMTSLNHELVKESKEGNQLATAVLSVNEKTTSVEIEKLKEKIFDASAAGSSIASSLLSEFDKNIEEKQTVTVVKESLAQIANPLSAKTVDERTKLKSVNQALVKASKEGNQLATAILSVNEKTSTEEISKLQEKIRIQRENGVDIAKQVTDVTQAHQIEALPAVNKVQTVSKEEYEQVKNLWKENYKNLEVPQGMAGSKQDWMKDDIASVDSIIALLSSPNEDKVQEGLDQVSGILPFLLVGGFSQAEVISYLKAKQDAAKETLAESASEEEQQISIQRKATVTAQQTMAATESEDESPETSESVISAPGTIGGQTIDVAPQTVTPGNESNVPLSPVSQGTDMFLAAALTKPKLSDIAHFEVRHLIKDKEEVQRLEKMRGTLEKIANPSGFASEADSANFDQLKSQLAQESQNGNGNATSILSAATATSDQQNIAQLISTTQDKSLTSEQYEEIRKIWIENYNSLPVPQEFTNDGKGRIEWITKDKLAIEETLALLNTNDNEKRNEGLKKIASLVPFLLLGGYSLQEVNGYLNAKHDAAMTVTKSLEDDDKQKITVEAEAGKSDDKAMSVQEEGKEGTGN